MNYTASMNIYAIDGMHKIPAGREGNFAGFFCCGCRVAGAGRIGTEGAAKPKQTPGEVTSLRGSILLHGYHERLCQLPLALLL